MRCARALRIWAWAAATSFVEGVRPVPMAQTGSYATTTALLAARRPRIAVALTASLVGWNGILLRYPREELAFVASSALALVFFAYVLLEMRREPPKNAGTAAA